MSATSKQEQGQSPTDERLREIHDQLTHAVEALTTGDEWRRALAFAARFRTRSFNNTLLIWAQHATAFEAGLVPEPSPTFVAGFRQWQQLGHQVLKGQHGYAILAPITATLATRTPNDPDSWRRLRRGEKPRAGEVSRVSVVGFRPAFVWDASQTSGPPVPEQKVPQLLTGEAPAGLWDELARLIAEDGYTLSLVPDAASLGGANGMTNFTARTVKVRGDLDPAARVKTLTHELAHIRMHGPDHAALAHRGIGEVEAESVALMVGAAQGMDTSIYTIPYVSSWATEVGGKTPSEVVQETGERVRRVASRILDSLAIASDPSGPPAPIPRRDTRFSAAPVAPCGQAVDSIERGMS